MVQEPINLLYPHSQIHNDEPRRPRRLIFLLIIALLLVGGCIFFVNKNSSLPQEPTAYDPVTLKPKRPDGFFNKISQMVFTPKNSLDGYSDDRINFLLLGIGGEGHDGPFLTDTMMIASIKPSTGQIAMVSIPRDLGVNIPGYGINKINHANAYGESKQSGAGPEVAQKIIEKTIDLKINYFVRVDFKAFNEIIDEVGGITINVDKSFVDEMYPAPNFEYQTIIFSKGVQTMNGDTALKFVRSRHGNNNEGSDFARAKRQQKVLFALKEKILSFGTLLNPIRINNIYGSLNRHIVTNLQFADIMSLARMMKELDTQKIITKVLDDSLNGYLISSISKDGAFLLNPKTGNFDDINTMIANIFETETAVADNTPSQSAPTLQPANVEIQNGTWIVGMAARMKKRLEDKNFVIGNVGNTVERPQSTSGIYQISNKNNADVIQALQAELHISIKQKPPADVQVASSSDILILLGEDMAE